MSRAKTFSKAEIRDAVEAARDNGLDLRVGEGGSFLAFIPPGTPADKQYPTVPFPDRQAGPFVYFLQTRHYIKIGVAVDVRRRHSDIQGNNPDPVRLVHYFQGTGADEMRMHRLFTYQRHGREWFLLEGDLLAYLDRAIEGDG